MESLFLLFHSASLTFLVCLGLACICYGVVYRLHLSPISRFPGPKLAALTFWYEFWFDVVKKGRYTWEIQKMHARYGMITRLTSCVPNRSNVLMLSQDR